MDFADKLSYVYRVKKTVLGDIDIFVRVIYNGITQKGGTGKL